MDRTIRILRILPAFASSHVHVHILLIVYPAKTGQRNSSFFLSSLLISSALLCSAGHPINKGS